MATILIKNATIVNEGKQTQADLLIKDGFIEKIDGQINFAADKEINAEGLHLFPGGIDDQVHFREPGLTHKGDIGSESRAAVAGGITSFMEMPNTVPNVLTQQLLQDKYDIAAKSSPANYSFFMGASNDNLDEVLRTDAKKVCGVKVFMGSSTGNMLVDNPTTLEHLFAQSPMLIATHCEDEATIKSNLEHYKQLLGENIPVRLHPKIRSAEACYLSSSMAVELAKKHNTRLHILHISTAKETTLFSNNIPLAEKRITAEACIHHLWFTDADYAEKGNLIKWNPAVKTEADRNEILKAVLDGRIDIIATDHAPHTIKEKAQSYLQAPSGGPLVQHALPAMLELYHHGKITLEQIAEKMAHNVATIFQIEKRGFIREGYWADLALVNLNNPWQVNKSNILYKCGWSPFEGSTFKAKVVSTIVSGNLVYDNGSLVNEKSGQRMTFTR
ncbi:MULTISPECIES: dihydroorotase [unclassified Mucilaginibacter]|uniref:dihydroorotase n=1 Tax=unclassified Mucilaginibacter TaxID=2617802 RepID=UPI002AC94BAD|nr:MULTISPECIES: dihydroorotase [unclassified Mucilaginibacter]MEB0249047.1 dihydroorotase [Mucilaginibacter sp. 5B2]MEB0263147.1 dihydroorotase [Mucilaginibacter sp. 10I4]MEB0280273.1 dihydroorotase [Mucilaginibacter sp. 10B2]MEB0300218.1 dihydroorotase [Mucilaginibacter sp. 5C4]WPX25576.1 dihydroorotase [Mucilaginibacter sp. 5C4]